MTYVCFLKRVSTKFLTRIFTVIWNKLIELVIWNTSMIGVMIGVSSTERIYLDYISCKSASCCSAELLGSY